MAAGGLARGIGIGRRHTVAFVLNGRVRLLGVVLFEIWVVAIVFIRQDAAAVVLSAHG